MKTNRLATLIKPAAPAPKLGRGLVPPPQSASPCCLIIHIHRTPAMNQQQILADVARSFRIAQEQDAIDRMAANAALAEQLQQLATRRTMRRSLLVMAALFAVLAAAAVVRLLS